jgi:hypothetical protein
MNICHKGRGAASLNSPSHHSFRCSYFNASEIHAVAQAKICRYRFCHQEAVFIERFFLFKMLQDPPPPAAFDFIALKWSRHEALVRGH